MRRMTPSKASRTALKMKTFSHMMATLSKRRSFLCRVDARIDGRSIKHRSIDFNRDRDRCIQTPTTHRLRKARRREEMAVGMTTRLRHPPRNRTKRWVASSVIPTRASGGLPARLFPKRAAACPYCSSAPSCLMNWCGKGNAGYIYMSASEQEASSSRDLRRIRSDSFLLQFNHLAQRIQGTFPDPIRCPRHPHGQTLP